MFARLAPVLFILIWSTGFVVARAVVPHASPELFLALRLILTTAVLTGAAIVARERWPRGRRLVPHLLAGAMLHGVYLCLSWWAVARGMPAGIMSLLGALQPLMIAIASFFLFGERLAPRGWGGLGIAILGVCCVLWPVVAASGIASVNAVGAAMAILAVVFMAAGTLIQRGSIAHDPICASGAVQNAGGAAVTIAAAVLIGGMRWDGSAMLWLGLAWSAFGLSAAGLSLLVWMVRHQGATRMSTLLLLVPPLAAIEAWWLFGERLGPIQLAGFALALGGVLMARARPRIAMAEPA